MERYCIACVKTRRNDTVYKEGIMCDRVKLAVIARKEAEKPYNGKSDNCVPNIQDIVALFPKWSVDEANGLIYTAQLKFIGFTGFTLDLLH